MGIRTFTFNGESSDTYGILITQNASFNAPERAGEMLSIPGRNGAFWQDYGRFENVEVTYHCAVGEGSKADFVQAMSDVRSWLCSPIGYCRLEDDYNPSEYRMAVYKSGLETDEPFVTGAEFEITFECKPQRFLKSGETAVSVTSGDTITNPTRFEAQPLLDVSGTGQVIVNDDISTVYSGSLGARTLYTGVKQRIIFPQTIPLEGVKYSLLNTADDMYVSIGFDISAEYVGADAGNVTRVTCGMGAFVEDWNFSQVTKTAVQISGKIKGSYFHFVKGTSATVTEYLDVILTVYYSDGTWVDPGATIKIDVYYDGDSTITLSLDRTDHSTVIVLSSMFNAIVEGVSSISNFSHIYLDMELGDAYVLVGGEVVSVNSFVSMPTRLATLVAGANTITYDNTITSCNVIPRWWKV